jgi:pyruvate/2-oxoglutarate dehydrogenase complex dihydrolipoamide dehydrogenase (E3) component
MTDLRKAAEMALEAMLDIPMAERPKAQVKAIQALRQALAQEEKPSVKTYCGGKPNYCTPEEREWVGLTEEDAKELYEYSATEWQFAQAIETKLKEKNT